jgi:hypothetical protein
MIVTEDDKIMVLRKAKRDKIFTLVDAYDDNCPIVNFCIDDGLLENITFYTTRLTSKGKYYLEALDFNTRAKRNPKFMDVITRRIIFIKYIPNKYWQLLIGLLAFIVTLWAILFK